MSCPSCGATPPAGARFCPACGSVLGESGALGCPSCRAPRLGEAVFCWACGSALSSHDAEDDLSLFPRPESPSHVREPESSLHRFLPVQYLERLRSSRGKLHGERRVVTILFADVKGSTAMADHLDPEEVLEIMNGAFHVLIEPITRQGGTIARLMGDAVLAFFGAPVAHEDDPVRAARASLEILEGSHAYAEHLKRHRGISEFDVRVGINTGLVVMAEVGHGDRVEYTAMGDTVNLASRMESAAEPGTILITEATRRLLKAQFATAPVGEIQVRGKTEPVLVHRLLSERSGTEEPVGGRGARLVGRSSELERITRFISRTRKGKGGIVILTGEPGVGKSRIARELRTGRGGSWHWAELGRHDSRQAAVHDLTRSIILSLTGSSARKGEETPCRTLREQLERIDPSEVSHLLPYLSFPLNCGTGDTSSRLPQLDPAAMRARVAASLRRYIRLLGGTGGTAILWDDFHAADASALSQLESLVTLIRECPVLFILVCREEEGPANTFLRQVKDELKAHVCLVQVGPLSRSGSAQLLRELLGGTRISAAAQKEILEKTHGNALFMEEVVRQLIEDRQQGGLELANPGAPEAVVKIPETLRGIVMSRFDALPGPGREVLQVASVLEGSFDGALIRGILDGSRPPDGVNESLEELCRRGFLVRAVASRERPTYTFTHNLARQLVAESMLRARSREVHQRAAEAIESLYAGHLEEHAHTLATHYELAGVADRAVHYFVPAVRRAMALTPGQAVVDLCTRALALAGESDADSEDVRKLHELMGDAYSMLARYPQAIRHYDLARSSDTDPLVQAVLMRKRATVLEKSGHIDDAVAGFESALDLLQGALDLPEAALIFLGLARVHGRRGEHRAAIEMSQMALEVLEQAGDEWGIALSCNTLGMMHMMADDLPAALEALRRAETILESKADRYTLTATQTNLGWTYHKMGKSTEAVRYLRRSIQLCEMTDNRHGLATASDLLSQVLMVQGERVEADRYLRRAVKIFAGKGEGDDHALLPELWGQVGAW